MKDKWSSMYGRELVKEIRRITIACNNGRGLSIPQAWIWADEWNEKQMRGFLRFLHQNLKEDYIKKVEMVEKLGDEK